MKTVAGKSDKAVSPIIATVLLIAITVTLVASLYTVLGSYFSNLPETSPTTSLKVVNETSETGGLVNGNYTLFVTYVSNNISLDHVNVMITTNSSVDYTFSLAYFASNPGSVITVFKDSSGTLNASYSGTAGYLTPSSSITLAEKNIGSYISRISLIDSATDASMGYITVTP